MNGKEIVTRTLDFDFPMRVARSFQPSDLQVLGTDANIPKLRSPNDIKKLDMNSFENASVYANIKKCFAECPDIYNLGRITGLTLGLSEALLGTLRYAKMLEEPGKELKAMHDGAGAIIKAQISAMKEAGADGIIFSENWASRDDLPVSSDIWKSELKPRYKEIVDLTHKLGMRVFMEANGNVLNYIQEFAGCGIDALKFDQPALLGIDTLKIFQQNLKLTYWCPVDTKLALQAKDKEIILHQAYELLEKLWAGIGGFIAGYYPNADDLGIEVVWQEYACEEFLKSGKREVFCGV